MREGESFVWHHLLLYRILQDSFKDCPLRGHTVIRCIHASSVLLMLTVYSVNNSINSYKTLLHPAWPSKNLPESKNCLGNTLQWGVCLVPSPSTKSPPPLHLYGLVWRTPRGWGWTGWQSGLSKIWKHIPDLFWEWGHWPKMINGGRVWLLEGQTIIHHKDPEELEATSA